MFTVNLRMLVCRGEGGYVFFGGGFFVFCFFVVVLAVLPNFFKF